jgi:hypothetical protein
MDIWLASFARCGIDHEFYTLRERSTDEILPWDFIDIGVNRKFFIREWERALEEKVTPNCRQMCSGCGARSFGGGVCFEEHDPTAGKAYANVMNSQSFDPGTDADNQMNEDRDGEES